MQTVPVKSERYLGQFSLVHKLGLPWKERYTVWLLYHIVVIIIYHYSYSKYNHNFQTRL